MLLVSKWVKFFISGDAVRQHIDPGNANDEIASDGNVVGIPVAKWGLARGHLLRITTESTIG